MDLASMSNVYMIGKSYTSQAARMRTNIEIDDELLASAMKASGLTTKRATVEEGLRLLVRLRSRAEAFEELRGIGWEGNLDEMREGRFFDDHDSRG
jgi:Arc/MetJ family transcription regulator